MYSRLPFITGDAAVTTSAAQYNALAAGNAVGGNYLEFVDAAELGFFSNDQAGYALFLAWKSKGTTSPEFRLLPPEYIGWSQASVGANAVVSGAHQGNNMSPLWTPDAWTKTALAGIRGIGTNLGWSETQVQAANVEFATDFPRLLAKWGYKGPVNVSAATAEQLYNPVTKTYLTKGVDYSRYTVDSATQVTTLYGLDGNVKATWGTGPGGIDPGEAARTAAAREATFKPAVHIMVAYTSPPSPGDGYNFAVLAWRPFLVGPYGQKPNGSWVKGTGFVHRVNDAQIVITSIEDSRYDVLGNPFWDKPTLDAALTASGSGSPLPSLALAAVSDPKNIYVAQPSGTVPPLDNPPGSPATKPIGDGSPVIPGGSDSNQPPAPYNPTIDGPTLPVAHPDSWDSTDYVPPSTLSGTAGGAVVPVAVDEPGSLASPTASKPIDAKMALLVLLAAALALFAFGKKG